MEKINEPWLVVDDHHGIFMMQLWYVKLPPFYREQVNSQLSSEVIKDLLDVRSEWHHEACDEVTNIKLVTEDGVPFNVQYAEGGLWAIPESFYEDEEACEAFFGC